MPAIACPKCRARYKVPGHAVGRKTQCKKCGSAFRIAEAPETVPGTKATPAAADDGFDFSAFDALSAGEAVDDGRDLSPDALAGVGWRGERSVIRSDEPALAESSAAPPGFRNYAQYVGKVAGSLAFFTDPKYIITFVILWILLAVGNVMQTAGWIFPGFLVSGFLLLGAFVVAGWYMAYKMRLVTYAAGDTDELPALGADDDMWDGVIVPFFRMAATYVFAGLPALVFLLVLQARMGAALAAAPPGPTLPGIPIPGSLAIINLIFLAVVGYFFWPMMVLVVSCGDSVLALFRLDLIFETIVRTFPAYILTVLAVYIAFGVQAVVVGFVAGASGEDATIDWTQLVVLPAIFTGISLYFDIVAMRAIGFYYRHFKADFAWSWG